MPLSPDQINPAGQIVGFRLHDGCIVGLSFEEGQDLILIVRRLDHTNVKIVFGTVSKIGIAHFTSFPIVSDVFAWTPNSVPANAVSRPDGPGHVLFGNGLSETTLPGAIESAISAPTSRFLVLVECSYGGSLAALCESIDVQMA